MESIKILIVEDEFIIATNLKMILEDFGYTVLEPAATEVEAKNKIDQEEIDLVILDINLSGNKEGIDLARYINEKQKIPFIYLTSNSDKATIQEAKLTRPNAFLVKPFKEDEIYAAIELAVGLPEDDNDNKGTQTPLLNDCLFVKLGNKFIRVKISDITYIEADGKMVSLFVNGGQKLHLKMSLESVYALLKGHGIVRVQRSYLINLNYLTAISGEFVYIEGNGIPIGRQYKDSLLSRLKTIH